MEKWGEGRGFLPGRIRSSIATTFALTLCVILTIAAGGAVSRLPAGKGMMALPVYLLLGNPRMALVQSPTWRVVEDHTEAGSRLLTIVDAPHSILPVRIPGGAGYTCIETGNCRTTAGAVAGGVLACLDALWVVARTGDVTITSKPVGFSWPAIVATFVLMTGASEVYLGARRRSGRIFVIVLAASLTWLLEALYFGYKAFVNLTVFQPREGATIYNYNTAILSGCLTVIICVLLPGILLPLQRLVRRPAER